MATFAFFSGPGPWLVLAGLTVLFLWVDLHFFARGREPSFREGVWWSVGWLVVSLLAAVVVWVLSDAEDAVTYTTVYFIERSLSLDNLFVFILLFSYFGVPEEHRARLLRRFFPVTGEYHDAHWFVKFDHQRYVTPLFLCLAAIVAADIAFAVDSIPAAFAITRDSVLIWMGNVFALLGMRALFVLVEGLIKRFRYLDETIAVVLA